MAEVGRAVGEERKLTKWKERRFWLIQGVKPFAKESLFCKGKERFTVGLLVRAFSEEETILFVPDFRPREK